MPPEKVEPLTPAMVKRAPIAPPDEASRGWRMLGVGLATAAAMLAMAIAMAMIRRATPATNFLIRS